MMPRVLVAGMGNLLQRDDGFGVEVIRQLLAEGHLPSDVQVIEVGIGGIHLVQELMDQREALILVDAMDRDGSPGSLYLVEPQVPNLDGYRMEERHDFLTDTHYAIPSKVLILAKALGVLPPKVLLVGCQPLVIEELGIGLSEPVTRAVGHAITHIRQALRALLSEDSDRLSHERKWPKPSELASGHKRMGKYLNAGASR